MKELDLEYKIFGEGKDMLVIETGIGGSFYDWYPIIEEIKEYFTVIVYHRAGYGKSNSQITPRTTRNIAKELNCLVEEIGLKDKFILMGHSFGGLCVQQYAKMYPNKLKGIILIDSTSINYKQLYMLDIPVMCSLIQIDQMIENNSNTSKKSKEDLKDQNKNMVLQYKNHIPNIEMTDVEDFFSNPNLYKTTADEFQNWEINSKDIRSITNFPNIPLIAIARDNKVSEDSWVKYNIPVHEAVQYENEWRKLQIELSTLSGKGQLIIAENSDHEIYLDRPDIIIQCLKTLL
ncbi:alpha/beta hydrolase [Clostridium sp. CS001]|uniref:alpha/beta fold hydrolase n=1 Tax=Clostridium sp. CS001 TaxID=2880648 RepID=UPI001CF0E12C|nr:alpha/beta fold hydrolase [Clostridium sp. CS001]MCB2290947.1 alpha/beta hydrolase [Clostridium sp. CS001]